MKKLVILVLMLSALGAAGQRNAVKTNVVGWATMSFNAAFEMSMGSKSTLEIGGSYNPWDFANNKKIRHWFARPEFRMWNCERFTRGFWGVHLIGGQFNVGGFRPPFNIFPSIENYRYQGWAVGAGVSYGYAWYLSPRLNLEATVGAGYIYADYSRYACGTCGEKLGEGKKNYFGPTKLAISLAYLF